MTDKLLQFLSQRQRHCQLSLVIIHIHPPCKWVKTLWANKLEMVIKTRVMVQFVALFTWDTMEGAEREREERVTRIRNWFISYVSTTLPSLLPTPLEWHNARFNWIDSLRYAEQAVPERVKEREDREANVPLQNFLFILNKITNIVCFYTKWRSS